MNVSPKLISLTEQINTNSKNAHRLSKSSSPMDEQLTTKVLAEDVYHKGEHTPQSESTYDRPMEIHTLHSKMSQRESITKTTETIYNEIPAQLSFIRPEFKEIKNEIESEAPILKSKDWGYSVDETGKLIALGDISEDERSLIEDKLNQDGQFVRANQGIAELVTKGVEYDRAYALRSKYWGKYEVTQDNFKDIIDMKSLLQSTETPASDVYINKVDLHSYSQNLAAQLAKRAEVKYGF